MKTTRSNCVELEPLNNDTSPRLPSQTHHHGVAAAAAAARLSPFFVGEPANEVVIPLRDVSDDVVVVGCHGNGPVKEEEEEEAL